MKNFKKTFITYTVASIFCIIFNFTYSYFWHGVISQAMRYSFLAPVFGMILISILFVNKNYFSRSGFNLLNAGIATLALWGLYQWVIDVAGADTNYIWFYVILGVLLTGIGSSLQIFSQKQK